MTDALVAAFASRAARHPERPLILSKGRPPLRVGALDTLARSLRIRIEEARLTPPALVAVASPGGLSFLAAILALRRAGSPVLLLEPGGPIAAREGTASALGACAILGCDSAWPEDAQAFRLKKIVPEPLSSPLPSGTAFVKMTSGSAGRPRGVAVSTESVLADEAALAVSMGLGPDERIVASIPMSHSYGFSSVALPALVRGTALVLPDSEGPLGPVTAARVAEATLFPTVPAYLGALLKMSQPPPWPDSVRLVVSAGAPLPPDTAVRFREFSGRPVHAFYGASECGGICFDREGGAGERGTVGTPVEGVRIELEPLEDDASEGLLVVRSGSVGEDYLPEPERGRLGAGLFRTSDVARWQGGELRLLRRADAVINVKGRKVDPLEIEVTLTALRGVDEVVALGVPDPDRGGHTVRVVIACRPGLLTQEDVLRFCRRHLADHKVPRSIRLVAEIPRTDRGKIDRGALAEGW